MAPILLAKAIEPLLQRDQPFHFASPSAVVADASHASTEAGEMKGLIPLQQGLDRLGQQDRCHSVDAELLLQLRTIYLLKTFSG